MLNRELRILRDELKHEQAVARGRIMSIKKDAYNITLMQSEKPSLLMRSSYVNIESKDLSFKRFDAIKDESLKRLEMENALKTLKTSNEAPRGRIGYIKKLVGTEAHNTAKSFFDRLKSGDAKDDMHWALSIDDSDRAMQYIREHQDDDVEVAEEDIIAVYGIKRTAGVDLFGGN